MRLASAMAAAIPRWSPLFWTGALVALPLVVPYRWPPLLSFYQDAAAYLIAALGAVLLLRQQQRTGERALHVPAVAVAPVALVAVLTLQQLLGRITYVQHFLVPSVALIVAALAACVGQRVLRPRIEAAVTAVAVALVLAMLAQSAWSLVQIAGYELQGFKVIERAPGSYRISGLVAQPNRLAALAVWGLLAIFYLLHRGHLRPWIGALLATLFLTTAALAASKGTYVYLAVCGLGLSWWMFASGRRHLWWLPAVLACAYVPFADLVANAARHSGYFGDIEVARLMTSASTTARVGFITDGWELFLSAPWLGVGWHQFAGARWQLPTPTPVELHADHAHNIVINLLAEVGVVGFGAVVVPLVFWLRRVLRGGVGLEQATLLAMLGVIALYSLFEFPLWLGHFLIPCALFIGMLEPRSFRMPVSEGFARLTIGARAMLPALIVLAAIDYARIERVYRAFYRAAAQMPSVQETARLTNATLFRREAEEIFLLSAPIDSLTAVFNASMSERAFLSRPVPPLAAVRAAYLLYGRDSEAARHVVNRTCSWSPDGCYEVMRRLQALAQSEGSPFAEFVEQVFGGSDSNRRPVQDAPAASLPVPNHAGS